MYTVIAYSALLIAFSSLTLALRGRHSYYWVAGLATYIFSVLAGFSVGQLTVGLTFVFLALGAGYSLKLITKRNHLAMFAGTGIFIGIMMVLFVDDAWLFYPLTWFIS